MKKLLLAFFLLSFSLFFINNPIHADNWKDRKNYKNKIQGKGMLQADVEYGVPIDKEWTITFKEPMDKESIKNSVLLLDENNAGMERDIEFVDGTKVIKLIPQEPLKPYKQYMVIVTAKAKTEQGDFIKNNYLQPFETALEKPKSSDQNVVHGIEEFKEVMNSQKPDRTLPHPNSGSWQTFLSDDYLSYRVVHEKEGEIVGGYSKTEGDTFHEASVGDVYEAIGTKNLGICTNSYCYKWDKEYTYYYFYKRIPNKFQITAIQWIKRDVDSSPDFHKENLNEIAQGQKTILYDLLNVDRVKLGLEPFERNSEVSELADTHAEKKLNGKLFITNTQKMLQTVDKKITSGDLLYNVSAENVFQGYQGMISDVFQDGFLTNIEHTGVGVGVRFDRDKQKFGYVMINYGY
ncbi:Ig-like domain-containing protein [Pontibacillus marinus]|uniref:SbsA Ig-like domain-containing protein n=1 Tax=Pontibacillus marinus BH030004 = DSM 16465 TaxID=1385511 RepID=A0A0A5G3Q4_9BACI|nr:Ig-like domain-containing protein [Pontibacillus marinus]KGX86669.1 hypothetical protein N783_11780 [Pontibacillus marinus BH030004 = DSM 16465]